MSRRPARLAALLRRTRSSTRMHAPPRVGSESTRHPRSIVSGDSAREINVFVTSSRQFVHSQRSLHP